MKIYIVGYMGAGKSRFGRLLAKRLDLPFFDLDEVFEERYRISVLDFFDKYGEPEFRRLENRILLESGKMDNCVISTGGGTPCFSGGMDFIRANGISIYLRMDEKSLFERLKAVKKKRPLIHGKSDEELWDHIRRQLPEREVFYLQADHILDALAPDEEKMGGLLAAIGPLST